MTPLTAHSTPRPWTAPRIALWSAPAILLAIPLVAMQFTGEVQWTAFDFTIAALALYGALAVYERVSRLSTSTLYRAGVALAVLTTLLLFWINGAVGVIGDGDVNLLYFFVFAVGVLGALVARFQPLGLARTLVAMAATQMTIPVIALIILKTGSPAVVEEVFGNPHSPHGPFSPGIVPVFVLNAAFALLFLLAAGLFRESARASG
jgi:hypothetical protein